MYRPLPDFLSLGQSSIHGVGLFANFAIKKDMTLGITHVYDERFENNYIRTPLGGFFNHSESPNCTIVKDGDFLKIKTIREIEPGEEITAYYTLYKVSK